LKKSVISLGFAVGILVAIGTYWAFKRGGNDFDVFYTAWGLVLKGHAAQIYTNSPDRYLYAPGFAFILSPLALLPRDLSLALWCLLKAAVLGWLIRSWAGAQHISIGMIALGVLLLTRPLLIDFEYGQVNLFILVACLWALLNHFQKKPSSGGDILSWAVLAIAAIAKIFPLPLLMIPFLKNWSISREKLAREKFGILLGVILVLGIPFLFEGTQEAMRLLVEWKAALQARGLPMESHNQSFAALIRHFFSGRPTPVISEGWRPIQFGFAILSEQTIELLSLAWSLITGGIMLGWIVSGPKRDPMLWISVLLGLLILPSHLVWKPYFVMGIPAASYLITRARESYRLGFFLGMFFIAINLTGFNFTGHAFASQMEAAAIFLIAHVFLLILTARSEKTAAR